MTAAGIPAAGASIPVQREVHFRRALAVLSVLAALVLLLFAATTVWARNEMSPVESVVGAQASMLARQGTLYYALNEYPYTVCAYTPVFYLLQSALHSAGLPVLLAGRLISVGALITAILMCGRLVCLYTGVRYAAWIGVLLASFSMIPLWWGTVAQVDMLAVCLSLTAFYQFSGFYVHGQSRLLAAGALALLAFFTKQTMVAAPAAMVLLLFFRNRRQGFLFASAWGGALAAVALAVNQLTDGRFLANTVLANLNPFSAEKFAQQLGYFGVASGSLLLTLALVIRFLVRARLFAPLVYLICAAGVFLVTAPKVGSDTNYQLEIAFLLAACVSAGLPLSGFFAACFSGRNTWITMIQIPLLLHAAVNIRGAVNMLMARWATETGYREEVAAISRYIRPENGRIISANYNAALHLRGRMDVEVLIYRLLVDAGVVDPEPVRRDIARRAIPAIILYQDIFRDSGAGHAEISTLPAGQVEEMKRNYRLAAHIPGPYQDGSYIYQPLSGSTQ